MSQDHPLPPGGPLGPGSQPNPLERGSLSRLSQPSARLSQPIAATGGLRSRRQAEAAQQAQSELNVLTEQLLDLPERLRAAGLAGTKGQQLHEALEAFTELAALAWAGLAEGNFAEVAATPIYRQRAVAATRRVSRLQQEAASSRPLTESDWELPAPEARPTGGASMRVAPLWRFRTRLYAEALSAWRQSLKAGDGGGPAVFSLGSALEDLRAAVGFAGMSTAHIVFFRLLTFLAVFIGGFIAATTVGVAASAFVLGLDAPAATLGIVAGALTLTWAYATTLLITGRISLRFVMGAVRWRLIEAESSISQGLLTGWHWIATTLGMLAGLGTVGYAGWLFARTFQPGGALSNPTGLTEILRQVAGVPLVILAGTVGVLLALPLLVALPALVIYQGMLGRELARGAARPPQMRRVALGGALPVLAFLTLLGLAGLLAAARYVPTLTQPLLVTRYGQVTPLAPAAFGIIVLLYLLAVAFPYAAGTRRWRQARLDEVQAQKRDVSARLDRLAPEPALADDVPTVQYDVARLQYLKLQEEDFSRARAWPYSVAATLFAFVVTVGAALVLDNGFTWAVRTLRW
jgi:hypothetical protein